MVTAIQVSQLDWMKPIKLHAGDPRRLLHHLGLGVWSFLAEPAAGLLRTTRGGGIRRLPEVHSATMSYV